MAASSRARRLDRAARAGRTRQGRPGLEHHQSLIEDSPSGRHACRRGDARRPSVKGPLNARINDVSTAVEIAYISHVRAFPDALLLLLLLRSPVPSRAAGVTPDEPG